jgi:hypothetical protein
MAMRRPRTVPDPEPSREIAERGDVVGRSLVAAAAAIKLDGPSIQRMRVYDQEWQQEAWRHYDINGELRFVANRHAAAMSRARLFVADVDEQGNIQGETKDAEVQALGTAVFGTESKRAEGVRNIAIQQYIAGECYVVALGGVGAGGKPDPNNDKWFVVSRKEIRKLGNAIQVKQPLNLGGQFVTLKQGTDLFMRVWQPHPRLTDVADSPTRAVLPTLREIERLTMLAFSQIDSRLISAGLLLLPEGIDFPKTDEQKSGIQGLQDMILEAARAQLQGAGTAAGLVPIMATVPLQGVEGRGSIANSFAHIKFDTPLTAEIEKKLDQAIRRLALGLDVAPEDLLGQGDANHWSGWQIEESSIKIFIEPALVRLCGALDEGWLNAGVKALGKDPNRFAMWYDVSGLVVRPNRQQDALSLHEVLAISDEALRQAGAWDDNTAPSTKELAVRRMWDLVKALPALIGDPQVAKMLGLPEGIQVPGGAAALPPGANQAGMLPPDQGAQGGNTPDAGSDTRALPAQPSDQESPAQAGVTAAGIPFRRVGPHLTTILPAAEQVVLTALQRAGARLLDRASRGQYSSVPHHDLHTRIQVKDRDHARKLLDGSFTHVGRLAEQFEVNESDLTELLSVYCAELLVQGYPHDPAALTTFVTKAAGRVRRRA